MGSYSLFLWGNVRKNKLIIILIIFILCFLVFASCAKEEIVLDFPKGLKIFDEVLSWNKVDNATSYSVYNNDKLIAENIEENSFNLASLTDGVYSFTIVAQNEEVVSAHSIPKKYVVDNFSQRIAAGEAHSLVIDYKGQLWAFGDNSFKQTGGDNTFNSTPELCVENVQFKAVSAGGDFTIALDKEGYLWSWGANSFGQLATGDLKEVAKPQKSPLNLKFKYISAGNSFAFGIDESGFLWAWGDNSNGKLGCGDKVNKRIPVKVKTILKMKTVSAGFAHAVAIDENDNLWGWGNNLFSQIGKNVPSETGSMTPVIVSIEKKFKKCVAGLDKSFAIDFEGKLHTFGKDEVVNDCINKDEKVSFVDAKNENFVIVKEDKKSLLLYDGNIVKSFNINDIVNVAIGGGHCLISDAQNMVYSYGDNISGQLGYDKIYNEFNNINFGGK